MIEIFLKFLTNTRLKLLVGIPNRYQGLILALILVTLWIK